MSKAFPGDLEGCCPLNMIRNRQHVRRIRKLAQQGFLAPFPAREPHGGERETA